MKKGWKKGWKVLCNDRTSAYMYLAHGGVTYNKKEYVVPQKDCGPLCVFTNKHDAEAWVLEFLYNAAINKRLIVPCFYKPSNRYIVRNKVRGATHKNSLPPGTALADVVYCLE
jgi:hypothetical protein